MDSIQEPLVLEKHTPKTPPQLEVQKENEEETSPIVPFKERMKRLAALGIQ